MKVFRNQTLHFSAQYGIVDINTFLLLQREFEDSIERPIIRMLFDVLFRNADGQFLVYTNSRTIAQDQRFN